MFCVLVRYGADSLFVSRPFAEAKKSSNVFSEAIKDAQTTVLQCHVLVVCFFHSANHDVPTGRPLVLPCLGARLELQCLDEGLSFSETTN